MCTSSVLFRHMGGVAGTHQLHAAAPPMAFPSGAAAVFLAVDAKASFLDCAVASFRSRAASALSSFRTAAAVSSFSSCRMVATAGCR
nr:unnamed protein product [Digitaria exilis]